MTDKELELRTELIETSRRAIADGLTWGTAGNLSVRSPNPGHVLITPSGMSYGAMTPEDIVTVDLDGQVIRGKHAPSFETPVHCAMYRARRDVQAVMHTEPPYVNGFGIARMEIPIVMHNLATSQLVTPVPVGPCMRSGSEAFAENVLEAMVDRDAVIWPHHGLLVVAPSLEAAHILSWNIENAARAYTIALQLGAPHLPTEAFVNDFAAAAQG